MKVGKEGKKSTWKCGKKHEGKPRAKNKRREAAESAQATEEVDNG